MVGAPLFPGRGSRSGSMTGELRSPCHGVSKNRRGDRDGNRRQRLEGCRHKLRDTQGPPEAAGGRKGPPQSFRGPVSPDHTLISGRRDRANECRSAVRRGCGHRSTAQDTPLRESRTGLRASSLHLHRPLCGCGASMGPSPRSPQAPGTGWHPARVWPLPEGQH